MGTLYLDRKGLEIRADGSALALYEHGARVRTVPAALLDRVVIRAETAFTSGVLGMLAEAGVAITVLGGRQGRRVALVMGRGHNDARIRLAQYVRSQDAAFRLSWACRFIEKKVAHQIAFLEAALARRADLRKPLTDALATLRSLRLRLGGSRPEIAEAGVLRGIEGAAQAAYFRAYCVLFPASLHFVGRNRRPPLDPVNACLSLGYTLTHAEAVRVAYAAGLDPLIGFYHETAFGRESLACDLIEPLRAAVDAWVWALFRNRTLREEHFKSDQGACLLDKVGRAHFYEQFEGFLHPVSRRLRRYCRVLVRALLDGIAAPDEQGFGEEEP